VKSFFPRAFRNRSKLLALCSESSERVLIPGSYAERRFLPRSLQRSRSGPRGNEPRLRRRLHTQMRGRSFTPEESRRRERRIRRHFAELKSLLFESSDSMTRNQEDKAKGRELKVSARCFSLRARARRTELTTSYRARSLGARRKHRGETRTRARGDQAGAQGEERWSLGEECERGARVCDFECCEGVSRAPGRREGHSGRPRCADARSTRGEFAGVAQGGEPAPDAVRFAESRHAARARLLQWYALEGAGGRI